MVELTKDEERALEYLENVGSDILASKFDDDFEPIGPLLRKQLERKGLTVESDTWIGLNRNSQ